MHHLRWPVTAPLLAMLVATMATAASATPPEGGPPGQRKDREHPVELPVTLEGTVETVIGDHGRMTYQLNVDGTRYELTAGPRWYWADEHPLAAFVGQSVTVTGQAAADSTKVDVLSVNDTEIRAAGRPPWAGGWKRVGARHPGWTHEKQDRQGQRFGCFPPGLCTDPAD